MQPYNGQQFEALAAIFVCSLSMSSLIVSLPSATAAHAELELPYALVSDGAMLTDSGAAPLMQCPKANELVLQVPATMLTWLQVDLPKPGRSLPAGKLRAVLEGLAEEQVLGDVHALHLALPAQAPGGEKTWVVACDKAWLASWLQLFELHGRAATRIVPQAEPQEQPSLHVCGSADAPQWIYADAAGVLCAPLAHAAALLPADLHAVTINAEPAVAAQAQRFLPEGTGLPIVQTAQYLARALGSEWNLGQFDLATTGSSRQWQRLLRQVRQLAFAPQWLALRTGLLVLLLAQMLGLNVWAWKERQTLAGQQQQLRAAVSRITGASYISDTPVQQAQVKVQTLQQATGILAVGDLEPMLAVLAAGLPPMPAGSELHYEDSSLRLRAPALSAEALQQLRSAAAQAGYQVLTVGGSLEVRPAADATEGAAAAPSVPTKSADPAAVPAAMVSSLTLRTRTGRV